MGSVDRVPHSDFFDNCRRPLEGLRPTAQEIRAEMGAQDLLAEDVGISNLVPIVPRYRDVDEGRVLSLVHSSKIIYPLDPQKS